MQLVSELLSSAVKLYPDKIFLDDGTRRLTYREFDAKAAQLAHVLVARGIRPGMPVGIYVPNSIELVLGYHAAQKAGAIAMPISAMNKHRELDGIARRTELTVLITGNAGREAALETAASVASVATVLDFGDRDERTVDADSELASAPTTFDPVPRDPEDIATLFFTSGTTGEPKGIMQSHRGIFSTVRDMEVYNRFRASSEVLLSVLPMFNNYGATCVMVQCVFNGGTLIIHERWDTARVLRDIGEYGITYFAGTPTMLTYMTQDYDPAVHDLSSLRLAVVGGAPVAAELVAACKQLLHLDVRQIYGSTEVCGYMAGSPVVGVQKQASTGPAFGSASILVVDGDGQEVETGVVGEVIVGGDTVASGYWRDPEQTALAFSELGWHSGDLGYVDEDGYLFIVDRKKDLIICGGFNIFPIELEGVLFRHPAVKMCAVVGVPDEVRGEIPVAYIVVDDAVVGDPTAELTEFCKAELAAYKVPRRFEFVDAMPVGPSGKILKRELRKFAVDGSGAQSHVHL